MALKAMWELNDVATFSAAEGETPCVYLSSFLAHLSLQQRSHRRQIHGKGLWNLNVFATKTHLGPHGHVEERFCKVVALLLIKNESPTKFDHFYIPCLTPAPLAREAFHCVQGE